MKSKKINLLLTLFYTSSLVLTPITLMTANIMSLSKNTLPLNGFSLVSPTIQIKNAQIIHGQSKQNLLKNQDFSKQNSKTLISNSKFLIRFDQINNIVWVNLEPQDSARISIQGTVVSALLLGTKLWTIINIGSNKYQLQTYSLDISPFGNLQSINKDAYSNASINNLDFILGANDMYPPVLAPSYTSLPNGQLELNQNEVFVYKQNGLAKEKSAYLRKFNIRGTDLQAPEIINLDNLLKGTNDRIMSIFIYKHPNDEYQYGIYHSYDLTPTVKIAYTTGFEKGAPKKIYSENINNLDNININNQMAYPKAVKTATGVELFWVHARDSPNLSDAIENNIQSSKIFSTKLNDDLTPLKKEQQPEILNLGVFRDTRNFTLIDYHNNGNFDDGTIYIPVKYSNIKLGAPAPSFINWKDTMNHENWNNNLDAEPNQTLIPGFIFTNIDGYQLSNNLIQSLNGTIFNSIDVTNNQITYLIPLNGRTSYVFQTRSLNLDVENIPPLSLSYNIETPDIIFTQINNQNQKYQEGVTTEANIQLQIQAVTNNYLAPINPANADDIFKLSPLIFNKTNNGIEVETGLNYNSGYFENDLFILPSESILKTPKPITLIQEPNSFIPLNIKIIAKTGFSARSTNFVSRINNELATIPIGGVPGLIGFKPEDLIQIPEVYIPFLNRVTASEDVFTGKVNLNFYFIDSNNNQISRQVTVSGFFASQYIIAIVVPILVVLIAIILLIIFISQSKKKKRDMFSSLQAGMILSGKLETKSPIPPPFKPPNQKKLPPKNIIPTNSNHQISRSPKKTSKVLVKNNDKK